MEKAHKVICNYLKQHIGEYEKIIDNGQKYVYERTCQESIYMQEI